MKLTSWASKWGVPYAAVAELQNIFGLNVTPANREGGESEAAIQTRIRLEASKKGILLWRNNVGATYTSEGSFIRYGLANDSVAVNKQIKSADLIGIRPVHITAEMVGTCIGQFVSREVKKPGWKFTSTEREQAQLNWAQLIVARGGDACFATNEGTL